MAIKLSLSISRHKASRLALPCGLLLAGLTIFVCGLVRTYHVAEKLPTTIEEKRNVQTQNERMEWWIGFPLIWCSILTITAVLVDKPILFKLSVLILGIWLVLLLYALFWDAGEFSWVSRNVDYIRALRKDGFNCSTSEDKFNFSGQQYVFIECGCKRGNNIAFDVHVHVSCEVLFAQYYAHAVLAFALASAIGLSLFTLLSFVFILKRISQITTALHLDEKPLSEDFANLHGDLYVES